MGLIRILIFLLLPTIALAQGGLQVQCEKAGNQVACEQWRKQKQDQADYAKARVAQQSPSTEMSGEGQLIMIFVGLIFWGGIIYGVVRLFKAARHQVRDEAFAKLPKDGPMRVSIKEEMRPPGSFNSKNYTCALNIKVVISQADWYAIKNSGLIEATLFEFPGFAGDPYDPENLNPFPVRWLDKPRTCEFGNISQMQEAKERLIESLHNLRSQIDTQRAGPQTEQIEI